MKLRPKFCNHMIFWLCRGRSQAPRSGRGSYGIRVSPWITIGASLVLIVVVAVQTVMNYHREKKYMGEILREKGAALIKSFEAGAKTGMVGMLGSGASLQILLEETASLPDISYIVMVAPDGLVLAHNNRGRIGTRFNGQGFKTPLSFPDESQWRVVDGGKGRKYFEVFKTFLPGLKGSNQIPNKGTKAENGTGRDWLTCCSPAWTRGMDRDRILDPENRPIILIGMEVAPFEEAVAEDLKHSIIMVSIILSLGMAGVISLFWAQNYTRSRKLLQDTKAFASEIVTNLPVGIIALDTDHRVIHINQVACTLLGITMDAAENRYGKDLLPDKVWRMHGAFKVRQRIVEQEISLVAMDGTTTPVAVSVTDIIGDGGQGLGFMFVFKDLSELRSLEARSKKNEKFAAIGNLAAGIAHEVRNPLSSIKGYVTFFGSLFEKGSENRRAADLMAGEVDRVNRVISELLEFARPADLKFKETDMEQLITHSIRIITHEAHASGIEITKQIDPGLPKIMADPDRLMQVLLNLHINAIQAMNGGGELGIQVRRRKDNILIEIHDTGRGISVEDRENLFNPYFTTKQNGTGLGLAIAHKIVENHGGCLEVRSREDIGTNFIISLPVKMERTGG